MSANVNAFKKVGDDIYVCGVVEDAATASELTKELGLKSWVCVLPAQVQSLYVLQK